MQSLFIKEKMLYYKHKLMKKISPFKLIMISAMYENGGNTTHRFLDGHPELSVYPFESQLGTTLVNDYLQSIFPVKYRNS